MHIQWDSRLYRMRPQLIRLVITGLIAILTFYVGASNTTLAYNGNAEHSDVYLQQQDAGVGWCSWSPDGETIAFDVQVRGNKDIYTVEPDGSNLRKLTNLKAVDSLPSWSPDSEKIVFFSDRGANGDIWVMDADGSNPERLTDHAKQDSLPSFSPDGEKLYSVRRGLVNLKST